MTDTIRPSASDEIPGAKQSEKLAIPAAPRPGLFVGEPTPDQLAAEEELIREDLEAFEKEVLGAVASAENTNSTPGNGGIEKRPAASLRSVPRIASSHTKPARAKKLNGKKTAAKGGPRKTEPKEESNVRHLDLPKIFGVARKQLLEAGIPFMGAEWQGIRCEPISQREVCQKIMGLAKPDAYAVARILLTWKPERCFDEKHITSILTLLKEERRASIPGIIAAIAENPTDVRATMASQTPDLITQGTRDMAADVFDSNSDQTVRAPSTLKRTGRRSSRIDEE